MTPSEFKAACMILCGDQPGLPWARVAAEVLKVQERNVYYWAAGAKEIPPGIVEELQARLAEAWSRPEGCPFLTVLQSALGELPAAHLS